MPPKNIQLTLEQDRYHLRWENDDTSVIRSELRLNGRYFSATSKNEYSGQLAMLSAGKHQLELQAVNYRGASEVVTYPLLLPQQLEKISTLNAQQDGFGWELAQFGSGRATVKPSANSRGATLHIEQQSSLFWHQQYRHPVSTQAGNRYRVSYRIRANQNDVPITVMLQQAAAPYEASYYAQHQLQQGEWLTVNETVDESNSDARYLSFMIGDAPKGTTLSITDISVIEQAP